MKNDRDKDIMAIINELSYIAEDAAKKQQEVLNNIFMLLDKKGFLLRSDVMVDETFDPQMLLEKSEMDEKMDTLLSEISTIVDEDKIDGDDCMEKSSSGESSENKSENDNSTDSDGVKKKMDLEKDDTQQNDNKSSENSDTGNDTGNDSENKAENDADCKSDKESVGKNDDNESFSFE